MTGNVSLKSFFSFNLLLWLISQFNLFSTIYYFPLFKLDKKTFAFSGDRIRARSMKISLEPVLPAV